MSDKNTNQKRFSDKELQEFKDKQSAFMKEQIPYLQTEEEFTNLQAKIAENRLRSYMAKQKLAQLKAPPQEQPEDKQPSKQ